MAGWALARLERQGWHWDPPATNTAATFGCLLLATGFLLVDAGHPFPGWRALFPVFGTCLVLSAGPEAWINCKILGNRILVVLGLISYPLYLWHWPALGFARLVDSGTPANDVRIAVLAVALCLAIATHLLIERPLRRPRSRRREDVETAALLAVAGATGALGIACFASDGFPGTGFRDPARQAFLDSFDRAAPRRPPGAASAAPSAIQAGGTRCCCGATSTPVRFTAACGRTCPPIGRSCRSHCRAVCRRSS